MHERLIVDGVTGTLREPLHHEAIRDLDEALVKMNAYSTAGAQMLHARGKSASLAGAVVHGAWTFVRTYVLRAGFLDGREGFMLAVSNAEGAYYRYLKLMLLAEQTHVKTAVIVTTYNRPDALAAVLAGYQAQSDARFRADRRRRRLDRRNAQRRRRFQFARRHCRHSRLARRPRISRRRDPQPRAGGDARRLHRVQRRRLRAGARFRRAAPALAERGWFVAGNRILLSADFTRRALAATLPLHELGAGALAGWRG